MTPAHALFWSRSHHPFRLWDGSLDSPRKAQHNDATCTGEEHTAAALHTQEMATAGDESDSSVGLEFSAEFSIPSSPPWFTALMARVCMCLPLSSA